MSEENCYYSLNASYSKLLKEGKLKGLFNTLVFKSPYIKSFVGKARYHTQNDGNAMLFFVKEPNNYILIGGTTKEIFGQPGIIQPPPPLTTGILKFKTKNNDKIVKLMAPEGYFMHPDPYAIGEKNTYLFTFNTYIPNDELKKDEDPIQHLFFCNKHQKYISDTVSPKDLSKIINNYKKDHRVF